MRENAIETLSVGNFILLIPVPVANLQVNKMKMSDKCFFGKVVPVPTGTV